MVLTLQLFAMASFSAGDRAETMTANVEKCVNFVTKISDDQGVGTQVCGEVIARLWYVTDASNHVPAWHEQLGHFPLVLRGREVGFRR